jgi:hypothetical protein
MTIKSSEKAAGAQIQKRNDVDAAECFFDLGTVLGSSL